MGLGLLAIALLCGCDAEEQRNEGDAMEAAMRAERTATPEPEAVNLIMPTTSPAPTPSSTAAPATEAWVGRWRGVEGLNLDIASAPNAGPGHYTLTMQYSLDDRGVFDGVVDGDVIRFTRPDGEQTLRATDGAATGLKWLADKRNCLTVKPGEGYCRD